MNKSKMQLLIIGPYPRDPSRIERGVEAVTVYLVEGLKTLSDVDVQIISFRGGVDHEETYVLDGIKVHFLPAIRRFGNVTFGALERLRLRRKIRQLKVDLIHNQYHFAFPYIESKPPCPALTTVHGITYKEVAWHNRKSDLIRNPARVLMERIVLRRVKHVICVTDYVRENIAHLTNARMYVVENPVSNAYFGLKNHEVPNTLLFAGAIIKRKNILDLIKAIERVRAYMPDVKLNIVGIAEDARYYKTLWTYVRDHALKNCVRFLGPLKESDLFDQYEKAAIIALPSFEESAGMVLEQAMAAGRATIATRAGGIPCIVKDGATGLLVEPGNAEDLAEKIILLLRNGNLRLRLGQNGKQEATERFTSRRIAEKTYGVYKSVLRNS